MRVKRCNDPRPWKLFNSIKNTLERNSAIVRKINYLSEHSIGNSIASGYIKFTRTRLIVWKILRITRYVQKNVREIDSGFSQSG